MPNFSKPEMAAQAATLTTQILTALAEAGVKAELNENSGGIKIPEYFYDLLCVIEKSTGYGISRRWSGKLEVEFRSISFGSGTFCYTKKFKTEAKDLIKKVVASVIERRNALVAHKEREDAEQKLELANQKALNELCRDFPRFKANVEYHRSQINLSFRNLSKEKARLILGTLNAAGINND